MRCKAAAPACGNEEGAYAWLVKAKESALKYDAAPEYRIPVGMKFYHGSDDAIAHDDMGETAMDMIGKRNRGLA